MYGQTVRTEVRRPFWYEYIAMYEQTVRAEVMLPSGTSMGKQCAWIWETQHVPFPRPRRPKRGVRRYGQHQRGDDAFAAESNGLLY